MSKDVVGIIHMLQSSNDKNQMLQNLTEQVDIIPKLFLFFKKESQLRHTMRYTWHGVKK